MRFFLYLEIIKKSCAQLILIISFFNKNMYKKTRRLLRPLLLVMVFSLINGAPGLGGYYFGVQSVKAQDLINEGFLNGDVAPAGWVINVSGTYETDASSGDQIPSLKFGLSGDYVETATFSGADSLSFWIKGSSISSASSFLIEGYNGSSWIVIDNLSNMQNIEEIKTYPIDSSIVKARFTYSKDAGNLAFDDLVISGQETGGGGGDMSGSVALTITKDTEAVQNISPVSADIVFSTNADSQAKVVYGLTNAYGQESNSYNMTENMTSNISLAGLSCGSSYHYSIQAVNSSDSGDADSSVDAIFDTLPCGINIDELVISKSNAKAKNNYNEGWEWQFDITVWDKNETNLQMKFNKWINDMDSLKSLDAKDNMQFSIDNGINWTPITANDTYSSIVNISSVDSAGLADGRQVSILLQMKIPENTPAGDYSASYGIKIE